MANLEFDRLSLVLKFVVYDDVSGKMQNKYVTLNGIRGDITADEILQVGTAFKSLSSHEYLGVDRLQRDSVNP